ncbi:MAG: CsgG/HfaB family protein [Gemmatimonadales bacterium]
MKRMTLALLALAVAAPAAAQGPAPQDTRPGIAVLPFENGGSYGRGKENYEALQTGIPAVMIDELSRNPGARVVDRATIEKVLSEQNLATAGRVDAATAAKVGKLIGARYMIAGTFIELAGKFKLTSRIIDVQTGEIIKSVSNDDALMNPDDLFKIIQSVAQKLMTETKLPPLPAQVAQAAKAQNVPTEALTLYSRALLYEDRGDKAKAIEYYRQAVQAAPGGYTPAEEGLKRVNQS